MSASAAKRNLSDDDDDDDLSANSSLNKETKRFKNENLSDKEESKRVENENLSEKESKRVKNENLSDSDGEAGPAHKKLKTEQCNEMPPTSMLGSKIGYKMLTKMGYTTGKGLGRNNQGIVEPIQESNQKGRVGIGFKDAAGKEDKAEEWDFTRDEVSAKENPEWLFNNNLSVPDLETLSTWIKRGTKKLTLDDEDNFCSKEILKQVIDCKSVFDNLQNRELIQARTRSNPYESIGGVIFQNRAAMKMANIDSVFSYMFTNPKDSIGRSKLEENEPLYFADVCAGPGGFSEYVLWRKKNKAKGFGFTLKGDCDFRLDDFVAGAPEYFEPHYGVGGVEGDGDVTNPKNLKEFEKFVLESTNNKGVHFVMADGGFSVDGQENIQEILSKQLYLCQFLCAISILRTGGNFVCKLFDLFTPFSAGLIYLLYLCFEQICIHKPITSRPANSERYIICKNMKECKSTIQSYFFKINEELWAYAQSKGTEKDIRSIVPMDMIRNNAEFFNYFKASNEKMGRVQILNLKKIKAFASNPSLFDDRQEQIREECLKQWNIPDQARTHRKNRFNKKQNYYQKHFNQVNPEETFNKLNSELKNSILKLDIETMFSTTLRELSATHLDNNFRKCSVYDFRCMLSCGELVLLLSCGRSNVFKFNIQNPSRNEKCQKLNLNVELPRDSLILAEIVNEYRGVDKGQSNVQTIHIVDALFLDGVNLLVQNERIVSLSDRMRDLKLLDLIINKRSRRELLTIRVKDLIKFEALNCVFDGLSNKQHKKNLPGHKLGIHIPLNNPTDYYVYPTGMYIFKFINYPWSVLISKSDNRKYFFNYENGVSTYRAPPESTFCSSPKSYWENGYIWKWTSESRIEDSLEDDDEPFDATSPIVTKRRLMLFINSKLY